MLLWCRCAILVETAALTYGSEVHPAAAKALPASLMARQEDLLLSVRATHRI